MPFDVNIIVLVSWSLHFLKHFLKDSLRFRQEVRPPRTEERLAREFENNTVLVEANFELLLTVLCTIEMEFRLLIKGNVGVTTFSCWPRFYLIAAMAASRCPAS